MARWRWRRLLESSPSNRSARDWNQPHRSWARRNVVFPEPFGPITTVGAPGDVLIVMEIRSKTFTAPELIWTSENTTIGKSSGGSPHTHPAMRFAQRVGHAWQGP